MRCKGSGLAGTLMGLTLSQGGRRAAVCVLLTALSCMGQASGADTTDAARELLRRRFENPYRLVRVPADLYRRYLEDVSVGGDLAPAPVDAAISRAEYSLRIDDTRAQLDVEIELAVFKGLGKEMAPLLPASVAWQGVTLNGRDVSLHERKGWLCLSRTELPAGARPGVIGARICARAELRAQTAFDRRNLVLPTPLSALTFLRVDAVDAWEVSSARTPLRIVGTEQAGTHGRLGLAPGGELEIVWQRPRPAVARLGSVLYEQYLSWHLTEGVQEVRARLAARIVGGERERLTLSLPRDAERVKVTGADVREVAAAAGGVTVHLKGRIRGGLQLDVEFARPWPGGRGKTALEGFGIADGRLEGGALLVTNAAGGLVLADAVRGMNEVGLWEAPEQARALSSAAPVLAYCFSGGPWRLGVDVASLAELPVRETLVDAAEFSVLLRPDGGVMQKVELRVRNRTRQFLRLRLPAPDCRVVFALVSHKPVNVSCAADGTLLIPLTKSVETLGGAVSFPVKLAFCHRIDALAADSRLRLELPRLDLPIVRAECTLYVPEGFRADEWGGAFNLAEKLSVVVQRMEYGRGHLARAAKPAEMTAEERSQLLAENYYRSSMSAYEQGDYARAAEAARKAQATSTGFKYVEENKKLLGNIELLQGISRTRDRFSMIKGAQIRQLEEGKQTQKYYGQQQLLQKGWRAARAGEEGAAAEAFKAAEMLGRKLGATAAGRRQQAAALKESAAWLEKRKELQTENLALLETKRKLTDKPAVPLVDPERLPLDYIAPNDTAPNVDASGQLALQRAGGRARGAREASSLEAQNEQLRREIESVTRGGGLPTAAPTSRVPEEEIVRATLERANELVDENRYVEAAQVLEQTVGSLIRADRGGANADKLHLRLQEVQRKRRTQGTNYLAVDDLVTNRAEGRALAEMLTHNYGGTVLFQNGRLAWKDADADAAVAGAIANLRRNEGQKVAFNTRVLALTDEQVAEMGIKWNRTEKSRWAEVDEGRLNALLALERRLGMGGLAGARGRGEIVPGTAMVLANDATLALGTAREAGNTLVVDDGKIDLAHERVLLISANGRILALRAGATQFWTEEAKAPEIEEVPFETDVPAVGVPVRFEKVLVQPQEELRIECEYSYREVEHG